MTPQHQPLPILLTRPLSQGERFATDLRERFGHHIRIITSPIMRLRFLAPDLPDVAYRTLILTSETGVEAARMLREKGHDIPSRAICVGDRTAAVAYAAGIKAISAQGDAEALLALIMGSEDAGPYLHLRGREARGDIAPRLAAKGRQADAAVVYEQVTEALTEEARAVLGGQVPVILPVFSPRSAALLVEQGPFAAPLWVVAISRAAADAAGSLGPVRLIVADRPDAASMLNAIAKIISAPAS